MQILYAMRLEIRSQGAAHAGPFDRGLAHLAYWVTDRFGVEATAATFAQSSRAEGSARGSGESVPVQLSWRRVDAEGICGVRLDVRQPIDGVDAYFVSSVTLVDLRGIVTMRVVLGREVDSDVIAPSSYRGLYVPRLIPRVVDDPDLSCRVLGKVVDTRYVKVQAIEHLPILIDSIREEKRLPIFIIDTVRTDRLPIAKEAARKLAGLAQVVCLTRQGVVRQYNDEVPEAGVPFGGARLLWPTLKARHPIFYSDEVAGSAEKVLRVICNVAVVTHGSDRDWAQAVAAERAEAGDRARSALEVRLARAVAEEDSASEIAALRTALKEAQEHAEAAEGDLKEFVEAFDQASDAAGRVTDLEAQVDYWKGLYLDSFKRPELEVAPTNIPELSLVPGPFFRAVEDLTNGAIVFTEAASRSWIRAAYPRPESMREALINLGRSAAAWRAASGVVGRGLSDWFKVEYGLNVALQDQGLERAERDTFVHEGRVMSRIPHVQLDQHVPPNEVGRVYFGIDDVEARFVVDHVGLKLYGT